MILWVLLFKRIMKWLWKKNCREQLQTQYNKINFKSHNETFLIKWSYFCGAVFTIIPPSIDIQLQKNAKMEKQKNCTLQNWVCFAIVYLFVWMVFCANSNLYSFLCFDFEHYCRIVVSVWKGTTVPAVPKNGLIFNNCLFSH